MRVFAAVDLAPGSTVYACHADTMGEIVRRVFRRAAFHHAATLIWAKTHATPGAGPTMAGSTSRSCSGGAGAPRTAGMAARRRAPSGSFRGTASPVPESLDTRRSTGVARRTGDAQQLAARGLRARSVHRVRDQPDRCGATWPTLFRRRDRASLRGSRDRALGGVHGAVGGADRWLGRRR